LASKGDLIAYADSIDEATGRYRAPVWAEAENLPAS
jgi:hypothetical protein